MLASAGDGENALDSLPRSLVTLLIRALADGNIVFWIPGESTGTFGESAEDLQYEKERWRVKSMCR